MKIHKKPLFISLVIIVALVTFFYFFQKENNTTYQNYSVAVFVRDQYNSDPTEDARTSNKAGDVLMVLPENHNWSETEKNSYLILKMRLTDDEFIKITEPVTKKRDKSEINQKIAETKENNPQATDEELKQMREELENELITVRPRKYFINFKKLPKKFEPNDLIKGQPFGDQIFDWSIVRKK